MLLSFLFPVFFLLLSDIPAYTPQHPRIANYWMSSPSVFRKCFLLLNYELIYLKYPKVTWLETALKHTSAFYPGDEDNLAVAQTNLFNTRSSLPAPFGSVLRERGMGWAAVSRSRSPVPPVSSYRGYWQQGEVCFVTLMALQLASMQEGQNKHLTLCVFNRICARKRRKKPTHSPQIYQLSVFPEFRNSESFLGDNCAYVVNHLFHN